MSATIKLHDHARGVGQSFTGQDIHFREPALTAFTDEDICLGLSNICRFGGQIYPALTVAQHTILVSILAPPYLRKAALLHDAAEAYIGDVVKPLKVLLGAAYADIEHAFEEAIFAHYGVDPGMLKAVKPYDIRAVEMEHDYFRCGGKDDSIRDGLVRTFEQRWEWGMDPNTSSYIWSAEYACQQLRQQFTEAFTPIDIS